jgi:exodeoxyribonuclease VII small subunit
MADWGRWPGKEELMELKVKDFESALKSLEEIVAQLEAGDVALDRALELFEEGIKVSRYCNAKLEDAERKVETLIKAADGSLAEAPFETEDESEAEN